MPKFNKYDLNYLNNKPQVINWEIIAGGGKLSILQDHDLVFDEYDLKIRKLV